MRLKDRTGQRYGQLVALRRIEDMRPGKITWLCRCDCGNEVAVLGQCLAYNQTKSCGCIKKGAPLIDLTGQKFGRLTVIESVKQGDRTRWSCICDCGKTVVMRGENLRSGVVRSCGCFASYKSNANRHPHEYQTWKRIKQRCYNPKASYYKHYGGRGITVCDQWLESFENFYADMGDRPSSRHSIDRINVNGNYEPSNCRWATPKEQANNKRAKAEPCRSQR